MWLSKTDKKNFIKKNSESDIFVGGYMLGGITYLVESNMFDVG